MEVKSNGLELGLIGCGGIAGGYGEEKGCHLLALEEMGVRVKTYCDIHLPAAQRRLAQYGGQVATTDPEVIFRDPAIGAVAICTRHDSHAPLSIAAAASGKHVFVEKPLALSETECEAIIAAGRKHGVKIMVGFTKRYTPALRALAPLRGRAQTIVVEAVEPAWGPEPFWGMDPLAGGGQVFMCGTHIADALLWLAASEPVSIYASGGPVTPSGPTCLDKVHAVIEFANGTRGVFVSGDVGCSDLLSKFSIQAYVGKGAAVAYNRWMTLDVTNIPGVESVHSISENLGDTMRAFVDCIREDRPSPIPPEDGLRATRLIVRMIESIRRRQPVPWA